MPEIFVTHSSSDDWIDGQGPVVEQAHWGFAVDEATATIIRQPIENPRVNARGFVNGCACDDCYLSQLNAEERQRAERLRVERERGEAVARAMAEAAERREVVLRERNALFPLSASENSGRGSDENTYAVRDPSSCGCEYCKLARFEDSSIRNALVHSYNSMPEGGWQFQSLGADKYQYFLGVELETSNNGNLIDNSTAAGMAAPPAFWLPKHDGSVTGPEFASQPATLDWWRSRLSQLESMFKALLHAGMRSHDGGRAGMHVNISKNAFSDAKHLFRFLSLIHYSPNWSIRMSQRQPSAANQWAKVDTAQMLDDTLREQHAESVWLGQRGFHDRYTALNVNNVRTTGRFEFRLPRGTLRIDRFFKNLEWVVAMLEFTRQGAVADANPKAFMSWVLGEQQEEFPYLTAFINEKFGVTAEKGDTK